MLMSSIRTITAIGLLIIAVDCVHSLRNSLSFIMMRKTWTEMLAWLWNSTSVSMSAYRQRTAGKVFLHFARVLVYIICVSKELDIHY